MENNDTLNEMREQMQSLKKKLENQQIVNDRMLRKSLRTGLHSLRVRSSRVTMLGIVGMVMAYSLYESGFSLAFFIATELMLFVCVVATVLVNRNIPSMDTDMVTAAESLAKFKKAYVNWIAVGMPVLLAWAVWMFTEVALRDSFPEDFKLPFIFGCGLGLLIGVTLGLRLRRGIIRSTESLLSDLQDLKNE